MKKFNLLDCTLRDGGYYNNWDFNKNLIQKYLKAVESSNIKFVELGFRFKDLNKNKGLTAYTEDSLLNSLNIPSTIDIGIMINASDIIENEKVNINFLNKIFPLKTSKKIKFIRIACHHNEVLKLNNFLIILKNSK